MFSHKHLEARSTSEEANIDIYDKDGNFKWVSRIKPGIKVPKEYMEWRLKENRKAFEEGKVKPWSELRAEIKAKLK